MKQAAIGELMTGQNFTTLVTGRRGTVVTPAAEYTDAVFVTFSDGERKSLHKNVQVGYHWVN